MMQSVFRKDKLKQSMFQITENVKLTENVYRMRLKGDTEGIYPGQFVNIKLEGLFLRRPISVCDCEEGLLTIIYKVVGKGTEQMAQMQSGELDISDSTWKIYSRNPNLPAARIGVGAKLDDSMVAEGCEVEGEVRHSLLFQGVRVGKGAQVVDSVIMRGARIADGAVVKRAVIAENVQVGAEAVIGEDDGELCVLGPDAWIAPGATVGAGESVEPAATVE